MGPAPTSTFGSREPLRLLRLLSPDYCFDPENSAILCTAYTGQSPRWVRVSLTLFAR